MSGTYTIDTLDAITEAETTDVVEVVRGGVSLKGTLADILALVPAPAPDVVVSAGVPSNPYPGMVWLMSPTDHMAVRNTADDGWLPLAPQTGNAAAILGNSDIDGLWVATA